jgi:hypothetical protein
MCDNGWDKTGAVIKPAIGSSGLHCHLIHATTSTHRNTIDEEKSWDQLMIDHDMVCIDDID